MYTFECWTPYSGFSIADVGQVMMNCFWEVDLQRDGSHRKPHHCQLPTRENGYQSGIVEAAIDSATTTPRGHINTAWVVWW